MKNLLTCLICIIALSFTVSCEQDDSGSVNYVTFESPTLNFGVDLDGTTSREIKVFTGNKVGQDRSFDILVVPSSTLSSAAYVLPSSVTVPANTNEGTFTVQISDIDISEGGETLILTFGDVDVNTVYTGVNMRLNVTQVCPLNELALSLNFDDYPEETAWRLVNADTEEVIAQSSTPLAYGTYAGETSFSTSFCIPDGNYVFTIFDQFGDGICCSYGNGSYTLSVGTNVVATGGSFGGSESVPFSLP